VRFLWQSNAPWAGTGYGQQTRLLLRSLKRLGHEPNCFAFYGLSGGKIEYDGYTVWPNSDYDSYGSDVVKLHLQRSKSDLLITLIDLFVLNREVYGSLGIPWAAWTPIDSYGIGSNTIEALKLCNPVAMSYFGQQEMIKHGIPCDAVIYHAVDTDVFKPLPKDECRDMLALDQDAWVIGMVMANKGDRKQYPLQLEAIRKFMDENKDVKIRVFIHTEPTSAMGGWDMRELVAKAGLKNLVYSTNQYDAAVVPHSDEMMARIFNTFDVLMNCSAGEGFGIPIIEAQACGVPVVTHKVTAMPEITVNGYTVESEGKGLGGHFGWQMLPSIDDMVYRLNCVYRMAASHKNRLGRDWVIANCSVPIITAEWHELLESVQDAYDQRRRKARERIV
jgi:glycosyltransferase involved in cell wall biosynthesis